MSALGELSPFFTAVAAAAGLPNSIAVQAAFRLAGMPAGSTFHLASARALLAEPGMSFAVALPEIAIGQDHAELMDILQD